MILLLLGVGSLFTYLSSRLMAIANLIVARTPSIFGVYVSRSDGAFPAKWKERLSLEGRTSRSRFSAIAARRSFGRCFYDVLRRPKS